MNRIEILRDCVDEILLNMTDVVERKRGMCTCTASLSCVL